MGTTLVVALAISFLAYLFLVFLVQRAVRRRAPAWLHRLFIIVSLTVIPAALGIEIHVRAKYWNQYQQLATAAIFKNQDLGWSDVDELLGRRQPERESPGLFKVDQEFHTWWVPVLTSEIALHKQVRTNNLGFLSDETYEFAKQADEFRIVFLGDSMTGSTTMNAQWVDLVEDLLNEDPEMRALGRTFKTYNLGWPGAGFPHFLKAYEQHGVRFAPDLVVLNFIESDFPRFDSAASTVMKENNIRGGFVKVEGPPVTEPVYLNVIGRIGEHSLFDSECYHFYVYFTEPSAVENDELRKYVIEKTRRDYSIGKACLTLYPYSINHFRGKDLGFYNYRNPEWFHIQEIEEERMLAQAKECVERIANRAPRTLLTLMPLWSEAYPAPADYRRTKALQERLPSLHIEVMRERLPFGTTSAEEAMAWYNLPWDGHMSEQGGRLYAKAMVEYLRGEIGMALSRPDGR